MRRTLKAPGGPLFVNEILNDHSRGLMNEDIGRLTVCGLETYIFKTFSQRVFPFPSRSCRRYSSMEQARDDLAVELASGTPNYSNAVAGAIRYCPLIAHVLRSLEQAVSDLRYMVFTYSFV